MKHLINVLILMTILLAATWCDIIFPPDEGPNPDLQGERSDFYYPNYNSFTSYDCDSEWTWEYNTLTAIHLDSTAEHADFWIHKDYPFTDIESKFNDLASDFDTEIFKAIESTYGDLPDVDNNSKITVLFYHPDIMPGTNGFFDPVQLSSYKYAVTQEVLFIKATLLSAETDDFNKAKGICSHELQHAAYFQQNKIVEDGLAIQSISDLDELQAIFDDSDKFDLWMEEAFAVLAETDFYDDTVYENQMDNFWWIYDMDVSEHYPESACFKYGQYKTRDGYPLVTWWNTYWDYVLSGTFFGFLLRNADSATLRYDMLHNEQEGEPAIIQTLQDAGFITAEQGMKDIMALWMVELYSYNYLRENTICSTHRNTADLYAGSILFYQMKPDALFEPTEQDYIGYAGYNSTDDLLDTDPTDGYAGDLLFVYNYNTDPYSEPITADVPMDTMVSPAPNKEMYRSSGKPEKTKPVHFPTYFNLSHSTR